jgi:capsular exopolysaccharide synthesis family protein
MATPEINSSAAIVGQLRTSEAGLKSQLALLKNKYDVNYPRVQELQRQLDDLDSSIHGEVQKIAMRAASDLSEAKTTEASLRDALDKQKVEASKLNDAALQFIILSQDAGADTALYEDLSSKLKEASVLAGLESTNIDVTDMARATAVPQQPNIPIYLGIGVMAGLLFGCGLAFLREELDNSILTSQQVEDITSVPALTSIPDPRSGGKRGYGVKRYGSNNPKAWKTLNVTEYPKSTFAESYRSLRTALLLSNVDRAPQVIAVTSGLPSEGKSTTSYNLAAILAQNSSRVLLVNADMRRPSTMYGATGDKSTGLSTILTGTSAGYEPIQDPAQQNLFTIGPGPHPPYPAELLGSKKMARMIEEWKTQYDFIVFDTPPALLLTDAVVLAQHADAVILVVRYGRSTKQALRAFIKIFEGAHIPLTGIVINATDTAATEYKSYYGYGYTEYDAYASKSEPEDGVSNEK